MQCRECGYVLSPFDKSCPRCASVKPQARTAATGLSVILPPAQDAFSEDDAQSMPSSGKRGGVVRGVPGASILDPAELNCAVCGNSATQKVSAICQSDTWRTNTGTNNAVGVGMTVLAQKLSPPERPHFKPDWAGTINVAVIGIVATALFLAVSQTASVAIGALSFIVWGGTFWWDQRQNARRGDRYDLAEEQWQHAMQIWPRCFYCSRCDHVYDAQSRQAAPIGSFSSLLFARTDRRPLA